jgi:hypothetical protein
MSHVLEQQLVTYTTHELTTCGIYELEGYIGVVQEVISSTEDTILLIEGIFPEVGILQRISVNRDSVSTLQGYPAFPSLAAV